MIDEMPPTDWTKTCACCGGKRTEVRGRHPGDPKRNVCPTCMLELVEGLFSYEAFGLHQACQKSVVGKIRFYVTTNLCENDPCDCEEMREQLQAQLMGWA